MKIVMSWLSRNAQTIEAVAAVVTALVALGALVAVKYQLDSAERLQALQSARDAYRSHLSLAVANPRFAKPDDYCAIRESHSSESYHAFVDHLLYSAEQMLSAETDWESTFEEALLPHAKYICSSEGPLGGTREVNRLISQMRAESCSSVDRC